MDFLFSFNNRYVVNDTTDKVRSEIEAIAGRHWSDFSENITGKLKEDGSFRFTPKWTFGVIRGFGFQSFTYLIGTIAENNGKTVIQTKARPNYGIVAAFYCAVFVMFAKLFGVNILRNETVSEVFRSFSLLCFVLAGLMIFGALRLRSRFERLMQLCREE